MAIFTGCPPLKGRYFSEKYLMRAELIYIMSEYLET